MLFRSEKAIRYLGIAVVATSALALLGIIIGFIFIGVGHAAWNAYGPDIIQQGYEYGRGHHGSGYYGDLSVNEAMGLAGLGIGLGYVALGWELITAVVSLVAGILAIRGAADRTKLGGVFGTTRDLYKEFGTDRIRNTPISESAIVGAAVGAASAGMRPVAELMYWDFAFVAADQIFSAHCPQILKFQAYVCRSWKGCNSFH